MTAYGVALFVHILGVITLFGALAIFQRAGAKVRQAETVDHLRLWLGILRQSQGMFPSGILFILASGLFMTAQAWTFTTPWVLVAIVSLLTMMALGGTVVGRSLAKLGREAATAGEGAINDDLKRQVSDPTKWIVMSALNGIGVGVVWLMTNKPGWTASISVVVGVAIVGAAAGILTLRRPTQAKPA